VVDNAVREQIATLVRRHSAARADGTVPPNYFRVDGGKTKRKARKALARLDPSPDLDSTVSELVRRAEQAAEEHKWVIVRAMTVGDSAPLETIRFEGDPDPDDDEDEDNVPRGPHSAAEALARVALGQHRLLDQFANRLEQMHVEKGEADVKGALYRYHSEALQLGAHDGMVARVAEASIPQLLGQLPEILRIAAALHQGQPVPPPVAAEDPPEEPADAIGWYVDRIIASAQGIGGVAQANADNNEVRLRAAPHFARLRQLVVYVAGLVGLQVVQPGAPPPPQPPPADPPEEPADHAEDPEPEPPPEAA
jgi:hypothetical protein